jgi:hypothetical protein
LRVVSKAHSPVAPPPRGLLRRTKITWIIAGTHRIYIYGHITYEDIFGGKQTTGFCASVSADVGVGKDSLLMTLVILLDTKPFPLVTTLHKVAVLGRIAPAVEAAMSIICSVKSRASLLAMRNRTGFLDRLDKRRGIRHRRRALRADADIGRGFAVDRGLAMRRRARRQRTRRRVPYPHLLHHRVR